MLLVHILAQNKSVLFEKKKINLGGVFLFVELITSGNSLTNNRTV